MPGFRTFLASFVCLAACFASAQDPAAKPQEPAKPQDAAKQGGLKAYDQVVTKDAVSQTGMFKVHRVGEKVYFEIPKDDLGKDMLWSSEIAELPANMGYGGTQVSDLVVRWSRRVNKIYLHKVDFSMRATGGDPRLEEGVRASSIAPIIFAFDVETESPEGSPVIEVSKLFSTDPTDLSVRGAIGGASVDSSRSYIDRVSVFPRNIETRSMMTFMLSGQTTGRRLGGGGGGTGSATALVHYSLVMLPDKPMMGRLRDSRVGFFATGFSEYGRPEGKVIDRQYIDRYRLEKKDPTAAISEPVEPIVYYISREVPERWRKYIHLAIEDWQVAFEQAGFKNAIIAKDAPSREEDPNWDPEDVRYSTIRWAPTPTENAMGPHVSDPRSGQIMSAHVILWHNMLKLAEAWYFTQVSPLDPRAQKLPFPDDLMGELVRYIAAHEVGHTLGLEHNFKASSSYTIAQLRDPAFTAANGDEASIMDYGRFNYVAQPGDGARLVPMIGPYDKFAIEWGYKPIPGASNPDDEFDELDRIASRQVNDPMLRFGNSRPDDPSAQTEDLSNDAVEAGRLGMMNIERVIKLLVPATTKFGKDYAQLSELYGRTLSQRTREMYHVVNLVGGVIETDYHYGRGTTTFRPVARKRQEEAVRFLIDNAFYVPKALLPNDLLHRIESSGIADRALSSQSRVLSLLLTDDRIKRMADWQAQIGDMAYSPVTMVSDVTRGVWNEFYAGGSLGPDLYRRNFQRYHLELIDQTLNGDPGTRSELRPLTLNSLGEIEASLRAARRTQLDPVVRMHVEDCLRRINSIRNPGLSGIAGSTPIPARLSDEPRGCWDMDD